MVKLLLMVISLPGICMAEDVKILLHLADSHYQKRDLFGEVEAAIVAYLKVLETDPSNYEASWKLARAYWYAGNHRSVGDAKRQYFLKGIEAAQRATSMDASDCRGFFWLGVNYGLYAESVGVFEALGLIDRIKEAIGKAEQLEESCECGGPQRVLGRLYSKAPWFKGGSKTKAIETLKKSLELCPGDTQSRIFLAEIYLEEGKKGLAIQELKLVLQQEPDPEWIPETNDNKRKAEKLLAELGKNTK